MTDELKPLTRRKIGSALAPQPLWYDTTPADPNNPRVIAAREDFKKRLALANTQEPVTEKET